jgi:hypothetical protein
MLILFELVGKAVRSPAKSALLARMAVATVAAVASPLARRSTRWGLRRSVDSWRVSPP